MHIQPCHIQNPTLFRTRGIFKSLSNMYDDHANSELWHSRNSLFKHFQGYLEIFSDIGGYSATLTGAQLGGRGEASYALFKNRKKCPDFGKKGPDCVHLWVKFSIKNVVLRNLGEKNPKCLPAGTLFLVLKCPSSQPRPLSPPALKNFWLYTCTEALFIAKLSSLNAWLCSECDSVSITAQQFVEWPYAMYWIRHNQN